MRAKHDELLTNHISRRGIGENKCNNVNNIISNINNNSIIIVTIIMKLQTC